MYLSIATTHHPATDLGFLLHKHPERVHETELPFGRALVFYPQALKVRGHEYLRIIYGPEYDAPEHLTRLRERGLTGKRNLALREFALGHEGLKRFVAGEPLRRVHECVFGVLALESEPIDPRL